MALSLLSAVYAGKFAELTWTEPKFLQDYPPELSEGWLSEEARSVDAHARAWVNTLKRYWPRLIRGLVLLLLPLVVVGMLLLCL
ncbi:MAG: hypothetical protein ACKO34_06890 [Vampirovibrionales bacterium]